MNKCIDNRTELAGDVLRENLGKDSKLSVLTAYFTIFAFSKLKKELGNVDSARFILTDPTFFGDAPKETWREYFIRRGMSENRISGTEWEIKLRNELTQSAIAKECAKWIKNKAEFRAVTDFGQVDSRFICIENRSKKTYALQGLTDFTAQSLGYAASKKIQMVVSVDEPEQTKAMLKQFDEVWKDMELVKDVESNVLSMLECMYKENPPDFIYFVTLFNVFHEYMSEISGDEVIKTKTGFKETKIWKKLYKYQQDGVVGAIEKIEKYNGCILADSVGLGKTFEGLAVIKYYELRNNRVLVLCPKRLRENWTIWTLNDLRNPLGDDRFRFDVLNHTDLSRTRGKSGDIDLATINWGNYDLVVIDESHNFRNDNRDADHLTRYRRLMENIIKDGVKTKVLMLSATPLNTKMNDLKNQISLMACENDNALEEAGITSIKRTLLNAQKIFNDWMDGDVRNVEDLLDSLHMDYFKLLDTVTIARSRRHILKYYDTSDLGKFPKRLPPQNEAKGIDLEMKMRPLSDLVEVINSLRLSAYNPIEYILPEKKQEYEHKHDYSGKGGQKLTQSNREKNLIHLMRVIMLKRLESSVYSFTKTIGRMIEKYEHILTLLEKNAKEKEFIQDLEGEGLFDEEDDDSLFSGSMTIHLKDIDKLKWRGDLEFDLNRLRNLHKEAIQIGPSRDAKLKRLKEVLKEKISNPINPGVKKVLLFTTFADTAEYLYSNISQWLYDELEVYSGMVSGGGKQNQTNMPKCTKDYPTILMNFSPRSKERNRVMPEASTEIDMLIGTDCISEGQNLQDCDFVINYDIHWNPVRIVQRFGRIDRLGSTNDKIQLVNFWPCEDLDEYINLIRRVKGRGIIGDIAAAGEERELAYRKKQLEQLQKQVVDLEEMNGSLAITDLTFNDFKMDLAEYISKKDNLDRIKKAPFGLYSIAKLKGSGLENELNPGVIYVLRQCFDNVKTKEQNALHPYYLVHIQNDGKVRHGHAQAKHVLDIFKKLASRQNSVHNDLIKIFDSETKDGKDMTQYSGLLNQAVEDIIDRKKLEGVASIFGLGESSLEKGVTSSDDFELVTFLIIR